LSFFFQKQFTGNFSPRFMFIHRLY
jgi:hypothetical protein